MVEKQVAYHMMAAGFISKYSYGMYKCYLISLASKVQEERKEMFYLTTQSIHFIYGNMASDIW